MMSSEEGHEAEMVECVESWHLPSMNGADDGRHVIHMDTVILEDEQYTYTSYPFVFCKWGDACVGFAGISLAEQLKNIQLEINKLALRSCRIQAQKRTRHNRKLCRAATSELHANCSAP